MADAKQPDTEDFLSDDTLESLKYIEGQTPEEVAEQYKFKGNDAFNKGKKFYKAAHHYYTMAIRQTNVPDKKRSVYFSNRAAVEFELENLGRCVDDCNEAIKLDSQNVKAYYRASKASLKLNKLEQSVEYINKGVQIEPKNKTLLQEKDKLDALLLEKQQEDMNKKVDEFGNNRQKKAIWNVLGMRGVTLGHSINKNFNEMTKKSTLYFDKKDVLHWPVFFIYPQHNQFDFIPDFPEDTPFDFHVEALFPGIRFAEWDNDHKYVFTRLSVYTVLRHVEPIDNKKRTGKMPAVIKLDRNMLLKEALAHPDYIVPGVPVFWIVPPEYEEKFLTLPIETLADGY